MRLIALVLAATLVFSCAHTPARYHVEKLEHIGHVGKLPEQPGDSRLVSVPIGSLRYALYIAETYEALLPVVYARTNLVNEYAEYVEELEEARQAERRLQSLYLSAGLAAGLLVGGIFWLAK